MALEDDVKGWLTSKAIWGGIIAAVATIAGAFFKVEFPEGFQGDVAASLAALFGSALAIYGRVKAVKKIG